MADRFADFDDDGGNRLCRLSPAERLRIENAFDGQAADDFRKVVQSLTDEDITQRLQAINQEVLSRSSLEPMIAKYELFEIGAKRRNADGIDHRKDGQKHHGRSRKKRQRAKSGGFFPSNTATAPEAARNVTAELAGKYVNAQVIASTQTAEVTREFIDNQRNQKKAESRPLEKQRLDIMMQNVETLPDSRKG
jgi:hypothetical protein